MKKLIILLPMLLLSGCAYYQPIGISSTSIGSQYERPTGMAEGVSRRWLFFPCYNACPIGEDSLKAAIDDALEGEVGDSLANVFAERRVIAFPHILFPIIVRSDILVTGTLVKYNTKEFPQDNVGSYSENQEVLWANILVLAADSRTRFIQSLSRDRREKLINYALGQEKDKKIPVASDEADLFYQVVGRMLSYAVKIQTSSTVATQASLSYSTLLTYSLDEQKALLTKLRDVARLQTSRTRGDAIEKLGQIEAEAKNKIRACYPEKSPSTIVPPESTMLIDEKMLLDYMCTEGYLRD